MSCLYILIGLPGSGKSTWTEQFVRANPDVVVCSTDNMIEDWAAEKGMTYTEAFPKAPMKYFVKQMNQIFDNAVAEGKVIVVDRTNMSAARRRDFLSKLPETYKKVGVLFEIDSKELRRRLDRRAQETGKVIKDFVLNSMKSHYDVPTLEEFDEIIRITS